MQAALGDRMQAAGARLQPGCVARAPGAAESGGSGRLRRDDRPSGRLGRHPGHRQPLRHGPHSRYGASHGVRGALERAGAILWKCGRRAASDGEQQV